MAKKSSPPKRPSRPGPSGGGRPAWARGLTVQRGPLRWLMLAGLLWLMLLVLYPGPLLEGKVFVSSDSSNADAFGQVGDASLRAGHYPLWNPYLFAGMPSFGSLAYAKYVYPPAQLFNFLQQKLHFVPLTWLFAHLVFGGLGMMWLLSRWKLPVGALLLGAAAFLLFPKVVAWGVHGHGSKLGAAMYLPWIVGWAWRLQDADDWRHRLRAIGTLGILLGLQFLRGHVQITYYTLATVGWLSLWNAVRPFDEARRRLQPALRAQRLGLVVTGLALGALIGAVLLVPVHDYAAISIRGQDTAGGGVGLDYATGWSLAPAELGTLVLPAAAGFGKATYLGLMPFNDYPNYIGFLLLGLAAAAWRRRTRFLVASLLVFVVLVIMSSFGQGFYTLLYDHLPFFNKFRVPSMILILVAFSIALLAPRGAAMWCEGEAAFGKAPVLPALLAGVGALCLLGGLGLAHTPYLDQLSALAAKGGKQAAPVLLDRAWALQKSGLLRIGLLCLAAGAALAYSLRHDGFRRRGLVWLLLGLVLVDLAAVDRRIIYPEKSLQAVAGDGRGGARLVAAPALVREHVSRRQAQAGPAAAALAQVTGHERVWPLGRYGGQNLWLADGIRSLGGYHPAKLAQYEQIRKRLYSDRPAGRLANWLGAAAVVYDQAFSPGQLEGLGALGLDLDPQPESLGPPVIYRNRAALPRARLVGNWRDVATLPDKDALGPFLDGIAAGTIDVSDTVYLAGAPDPVPQTAPEGLPAPEYLTDALDEVSLRVDCPGPALLLLADMMVPGWQVAVDGARVPLLRADLVLRAVALTAGPHTVRFFYVDPAVRQGLTLTVIGVILALLLLAIPLVGNRLRPGPQPTRTGVENPDV